MKKTLLLPAACALSLNAATAGEITDYFTSDNLPDMPTAASAEISSNIISVDNGVGYTFTNCYRNKTNNFLVFTTAGAEFTATTPFDCQRIVFNGYSTQGVGKGAVIQWFAGNDEIGTVTVDDDKNFTFDVPAEYRSAGTIYKFVSVSGNNRVQSITYSTEESQVETWATPEFSIPDGSYVLAGQEISVTNLEEGATVAYTLTIGKTETTGNDPVFTIPAFTGTLSWATLTAVVSGEGKESSSATLGLNLSNGKRPVISEFNYIGYESTPGGAATFYYDLGVINLYGNTAVVKVTFTAYDSEGNLAATGVDDTINAKPANNATETYDNAIEPLIPTDMSRSVTLSGLAQGEYTVAVTHQVGNNAEVTVDMSGRDSFVISDAAVTGVETVGTDADMPACYYTAQGVRVDNPRPGQLLIIVKGGKAVKTVIR